MRVCHVCSSHRDDDARVFERECLSLRRAGHEVHLLARSDETRTFQKDGVYIHPVPVFRTRRERLLGRRQVARIAASIDPDVYHVHEPELLGSVIHFARQRPVVWDVHEIYSGEILTKEWIPAVLRPCVKLAWEFRERSLIKRCAAVVAVSEWLAVRYRSLHTRVVVLNNFPIVSADVPDKGLRNRQALIFTGTIAPNRGVIDVIRAMGILKEEGIIVTFELAGTPISEAYLDMLLQESIQLGVRENIHYHGHLPLTQTRAMQQKCGIGMVTHLDSEGNLFGYPVKLLEFMMSGLPLVFSDTIIFRSVAGANRAGIGVTPSRPTEVAAAIKRLLLDPDLADELGRNGRMAVEKTFNWSHESPRLLELYNELERKKESPSKLV